VSEDYNVIPFVAATLPCECRADTLLQQIVERAHELHSVVANSSEVTGRSQTLSQFARSLLWERRERESVLHSEMLGDPGWDMMLDLFAAGEDAKSVSVSSLCYGSGVPSTTALRWLAILVEQGKVIRQADPRDGRRVNVILAGEARNLIVEYLERVAKRRGVSLQPVA
jgi:DNA-binding MarR family transcriptional regulator